MNSRIGILKILAGLLLLTSIGLAHATPVLLNITQNAQAGAGLQNPAAGSFSELSPTPTAFTINTDFKFFIPSPAPALGSATGFAFSLIGAGSEGCSSADFAGFQAGGIIVTEDSTCFFSTIINNASAAGAIGVVIAFAADPSGTNFGLVDPVSIPSLIASSAVVDGIIAQLKIPTAVPEPSSLATALLALALLTALARRKSASVRR